MTTSTVNHLIHLIHQALSELHKQPVMADVERLAIDIHRAMDTPRRAYHTSRHVLEVCQSASPLMALAALYHDIAYHHLDDGFPAEHGEFLAPMLVREADKFILHLPAEAGELTRQCAAVFGFSVGQILPPFAGINEFASALIATRCLEPYLSRPELLAIQACIEATIPFRDNACAEALLSRLQAANDTFALGCADAEIRGMVRAAIALSNRDVNGFAASDPGIFLTDTWLLIEESNATLGGKGVYSVQDYRGALARMEGCLALLNPDNIFHRFDHVPSANDFAELCRTAGNNIAFARRYLDAKLATFAIIEALALQTGGDCPVSMLLGHIRHSAENPMRIEDFLPKPPLHHDIDGHFLHVLDRGRKERPIHDLTRSPLTAYVYCHLGDSAMQALFDRAKQLFAGTMTPTDFLRQVKPELRDALIRGCARISLSRRDALLSLRFD
jgi:hypothetical protein